MLKLGGEAALIMHRPTERTINLAESGTLDPPAPHTIL
jgi:hypothetical protein